MHIGPTIMQNRTAVAPVVRTAHDPRSVLSNVTVFGLLGVALIHLLDLPATIGPSPVQGTLYLMLMAACLVTAFLFLHATSWMRWVLVALIGAVPLATYILTRTVGLPFDRGDIGNWGDRLGVAALFVETVLVLTAAYALWLERPLSTGRRQA
jgi:hypothetical protein